MSGTLTPGTTSCTISTGSSTCTVNFSWSVSNPEAVGGTAVTSNTNNTGASSPNFTVATGDTGTNQPFTVPFGGRDFFLYNNGNQLDQESGTITATCESGSNWNGTTCEAIPPPGPSIDTFSASPNPATFEEASSTGVTLTWNTTNATSCTIDDPNTTSDDPGTSVPVDGTLTVNPLATTDYRLTCTGNSQVNSQIITVSVGAAPTKKPIYTEPQ
jgi:hypothetical protein